MAELMLFAKMNYSFLFSVLNTSVPALRFTIKYPFDYLFAICLWQQIAAGSRVFSFCRTLQLLLRRILPYPHRRIGRCSF